MESQDPTKGGFLFMVCGFGEDFNCHYFKDEGHCYNGVVLHVQEVWGEL